MAVQNKSYYQLHTPEHSATYYKKLLQRARGQARRSHTFPQALAYAKSIKEKYGIWDLTPGQFEAINNRNDLSTREYRRLQAAYWEREYKVFTGEYHRERVQTYLDRIQTHLEYTTDLSSEVLELFEKYVNTDTYDYVSKILPNGSIIFADTDPKNSTNQRPVEIEDDVKLAILKGAAISGAIVNDKSFVSQEVQEAGLKGGDAILAQLLMNEYDYSIEDAIAAL